MTNTIPENVKPKKETQQTSEKKWGKKVMEVGFNIVPSLLLRAQQRLGLSPPQLNLLLHLTDFWWDVERKPWPSIQTLADRMGLGRRQVQRIITELQSAGLVKRIERRATHNKGKLSNSYDLSGLVERLKELAPEFIEADKKARATRKDVEKSPSLKRVK